jgi:carbamoyltransferase
VNVLGLNFSLDSAVALFQNGRLVAAACQERFDRIKHSAAFPGQAIKFCLREAGIGLDEVEAVAVSWNPAEHVAVPNRLRDVACRDHREYLDIIPSQLLAMMEPAKVGSRTDLIFEYGGRQFPLDYFDHHLCHAAGAFYASRFPRAAILSADGYGETTSTFLGSGGPGGIEAARRVPFPHSLGSVYAAVTQFLGFRPNSGEGKVMALAGMGNPEQHRRVFEKILRCTPGGFEVDLSYFSYYMRSRTRYSQEFVREFGQPRKPDEELCDAHFDIAAGLQDAVERVLIHLAKYLHEETGETKLCLAGGVALNAVAMGKIEREGPFDEIFVLPPAHDGGGPLGAAILAGMKRGVEPVFDSEYNDRLGPAFDPDDVVDTLSGFNLSHTIVDDAPAVAAQMIAKGMIVGWMNGRMEYGPRALGARSILADPTNEKVKDIVNAKVKYRESFRPFAPVALEKSADDYFLKAAPSPYMNKVYMARPDAASKIPSVVHSDGSARLQTVREDQDAQLFQLISHFESITGTPVLLNTSFNKRGEPICATVPDALACFFTSGLDALFIGPCLIEK